MKIASRTSDQMQYKTVVHRFENIVVHRLRNKDRVAKAMRIQDEIRSKTRGGIDLTKEIRKWRETRCS